MEMPAVTALALLFVGVFTFVTAGEIYRPKHVLSKKNKQYRPRLHITSQIIIFIFHIKFVYVCEGIMRSCGISVDVSAWSSAAFTTETKMSASV